MGIYQPWIYLILNNINLGPLKSRKAIEAVFKKFNIPVEESKNISLKIRSKIPVGKGMASSTADIGATIGATLGLIKKELSSEEIAKLASTIEPTDSIYIEKNSIFFKAIMLAKQVHLNNE